MVRVKVSRDSLDQLQEAKERYNKQNDLMKKLDSPPPAGLIPVGDTGLYRTPDEISPKDCEYYPDSPYCGGNPITRDIIGLDVDYGVDGCSVHASVTPKLGFMKLPTHTLAYVKEECREEYEAREKENSKPPPPPPPEFDIEYNPEPAYRPPGFAAEELVCAATVIYRFWNTQQYYAQYGGWAIAASSSIPKVDNTYYPGNIIIDSWDFRNTDRFALANIEGKITGAITINEIDRISQGLPSDFPLVRQTVVEWSGGIPWDLPSANSELYGNWRPGTADEGNYRYAAHFETLSGETIQLYVGRFGDIFPEVKMEPFVDITISDIRRTLFMSHRVPVFCRKLDEKPKPPFIPPIVRKRKCCMQCCGSQTGQGQQRQNQDLSEIKKMLRQILKNQGTYPFSVTLFDANDNAVGAQSRNVSVADQAKAQKLIVEREEKNAKSIGIDQFPIYVPSSIVEDQTQGLIGDLKDLKNKIFKQRIESVAELLAWKIANDKEVHGSWQEYIDIQDSDPEQKGNQPKRVVLPNMARSFRELVLMQSITIKTVGMILDTILKLYIDVANTKVSSAVTEAIVRDIQGFLDYPTDEKPLDIPLGIKIPSTSDTPDDKEDIRRFLSNSTVKGNFDDWTGEGSMHDMMVQLLDAAAMIRAAFFSKG